MDGSIIGNYVLDRELGRGGMGVVYAARHRVLGHPAAIKLLLANEPERVERFFNEGRAAMAIAHPGIVKIFDVGIAADGRAFIAMELLAGRTLRSKLLNRPLPLAVALDYTRQIATALAAAHSIGILHRDLKPDNIFVDDANRIKIVDFGIAKLPVSSVRTATGDLLGTPSYMSPEQCEGLRELDARSDLYALGCVMFAMLSGHPPFESGGTGGIIASQLKDAPPPLLSVCPTAPPALGDIVACLLAKSRDDRFRDATALLAALSSLGVHNADVSHVHEPTQPGSHDRRHAQPSSADSYRTQLSLPGSPPSGPVVVMPAPGSPVVSPAAAQRERRRTGFLLALFGVAGVTALVAVFATRSCSSTKVIVVQGTDAAPRPDAELVALVDARAIADAHLASADAAAPPDVFVIPFDAKVADRIRAPADAKSNTVRDAATKPDDAPLVATHDPPPDPPPDAPELPKPERPKPEPPPPIDRTIEFGFNSFQMPSGHDAFLDQLSALARAHPQLEIRIEGHAASDEANPLALARGRANSIKIRIRGINPDRIKTAGSVTDGRDARITTQ